MKRLILLLIPILLFAGCKSTKTSTEPVTSAPEITTAKTETYLKEPEIIVQTFQNYMDGGWVDYEHIKAKNGDDTVLRGNGFSILLKFDPSIDTDSILRYVKAEGTSEISWNNTTGVVENEHCFHGTFKKYEEGGHYSLFIDKNITDKNGYKMKEDINIKFTLKDTIKAFYTYNAGYDEYKNLGVSYDKKEEGGILTPRLALPPGDREFIADFTGDVDRQSIEKSISDGLNGEKVSFKWINNRRLQINIKDLKEGYHIISMSSARDKQNGKIIGSMDFIVGNTTKIMSLDTQNSKIEKLKEFSDMMMTYTVMPGAVDYFSGFTGEYVELGDRVKGFCYKVSDGSLKALDMGETSVTNFVEPGFIIYIDTEYKNVTDRTINKKTLVKYDIDTGKKTPLFIIPDNENYELTLSMSPDGKKAAFYCQGSGGLFVRVFDINGKILFEKKNVKAYNPLYNQLMWDYQRVQWLDDNDFIYEDKAADRNSYDIKSVDLKTKKIGTLIKNAYQPVTFPEKGLIVARVFKSAKAEDSSTIGIFKDGRKISEFKDEGNKLFDFVFLQDNRLIMNGRDNKIYCYDPSTGKLENIADGIMRSISQDRKKIYFLQGYDAFRPEY